MLQDLAHLLEQFLTDYGYLAIFVLMFIEEAGLPLPLPNEVALMYVGYLSYQGKLDANLAGLVATLGAAGGSALLYTIARRGGRRLIHRFGRFIHVTDERLNQAENAVARWGPISIPIARLTPGLRIATTIVAGVLRVSYRVVILACRRFVGVVVFLGPPRSFARRSVGRGGTDLRARRTVGCSSASLSSSRSSCWCAGCCNGARHIATERRHQKGSLPVLLLLTLLLSRVSRKLSLPGSATTDTKYRRMGSGARYKPSNPFVLW